MMILDPLSIATAGYVGVGPGSDFCPLPLAIGSDGYIRFEVDAVNFRDLDGSSSKFIEIIPAEKKRDAAKLAALAIIAIEEHYD